MTPLLHTITSACAMLGISRTRLFGEIKAGRIAAVKIGSRTMLKHAELERYVATLEDAPAA